MALPEHSRPQLIRIMRGILARQMARMQLPLDVRESLQAAVGTLHAVFAHLTTYFKPRPASQSFYLFSVHDLNKAIN